MDLKSQKHWVVFTFVPVPTAGITEDTCSSKQQQTRPRDSMQEPAAVAAAASIRVQSRCA